MSFDLTSNFNQFNFDMAKPNGHSIYGFGEFRLNAEKLMLYRGADEISLPPKVIKTLAVLVENAGEVLSKDELMEKVWEGSIVEEANLSQYLYLLRKTLGQNADGGPYIETLRRRGYRFNGNVQIVVEDGHKNGKGRAAPTPVNMIAVERQGNVLRLVERAPEPEPRAEPVDVREAPQRTAFSTKQFGGIALAALIVAVASVSVVVYLLWRSSRNPVEHEGEMTITRLTNGGLPVSAAISRDGKYFAYTEIENETSQLWLQSVGQSSRIKITESKDKVITGKTFSPDGRFIYYGVWDRQNFSNSAVFRISTTGGPSTRVLEGTSGAVSFSPDGGRMTFTKMLSADEYALMTSDVNGVDQQTILTRKAPALLSGSPSWSPDGTRLVFAEMTEGKQSSFGLVRINTVDLSSGETSELSREKWDTVYRTEWAPDGKGILLIGTKENDSVSTRRDQVYYISYPEGVSRRITTSGVRHEPGSLGVTDDGAVLALSASRSSQIWTMDAGGKSTTATQLSRGLFDGRPGLAALPNGQLGYMTYTSDDPAIWIMNSDGSEAQQLTGGGMFVEELRADPLGRYFVFSSVKEHHRNHLYRIDIDGQNLKQLTDGAGREIDSAVSPDGIWVYYASYLEGGKGEIARLYRSSMDGGEGEQVGDNECSRPSFSPDGKFLSCVTENDRTIYIISPESGKKLNSFDVPSYATVNFGVRWLPDSSGVVYIRSDKDTSNLWVQPLDGSKPRAVTDFTSGIIYNFVYSTDGTRLFLGRGYPIQDVLLIRNFR